MLIGHLLIFVDWLNYSVTAFVLGIW